LDLTIPKSREHSGGRAGFKRKYLVKKTAEGHACKPVVFSIFYDKIM